MKTDKKYDHPSQPYFEAVKNRFVPGPVTRKTLTVPLGEVSTRLLIAATAIDELGVSKRLAKLDPSFFDKSIVDRIRPYGWALDYIQTKKAAEAATRNNKLVTAEVAEEATALRDRMLKVAEYHLGETRAYQNEIASIKEGNGYDDLRLDLSRLIVLYRTEPDTISKDPTHYSPDQVARAEELVHELKRQLGTEQDLPWAEMALLAFSVIEHEYWELRKTIEYVWRDEPEVMERFPTVFVRSADSRPRNLDKGDGGGDAAPMPAAPAAAVPPLANGLVAAPNNGPRNGVAPA